MIFHMKLLFRKVIVHLRENLCALKVGLSYLIKQIGAAGATQEQITTNFFI